MGRVSVGDVKLEVGEMGNGPEALVLSHSFLVDHRQFNDTLRSLLTGLPRKDG